MCTHYGHSYCAPLGSAFLLHIFVSVTPISFSAMRHKCQVPQMFGTVLPSTWDALPPDTNFLTFFPWILAEMSHSSEKLL